MPPKGVSFGRFVDTVTDQNHDLPRSGRPGFGPPEPLAVLRFPAINRTLWYRVVALTHARGDLPEEERRILRFLSYQRIGRLSGRIIGRRGVDAVDGGMELAERYAAVYSLHLGAFWVDLRRVQRRGFVERTVAPAPGRRAVYALVLRADAIPSGLPEDLARALNVHDLPAPHDPHEDSRYGRLAAEDLARHVEPVAVALPAREAAEVAAAARWEHPPMSPAALAAAAIQKASRLIERAEDRPDHRCMAVAQSNAAQRLAERFAARPETSPYNATVSRPSGLSTAGCWDLSYSNKPGRTHKDAYGGAKRSSRVFSGDDPRVVVEGLMRRVWASWRAKLGYRVVICRVGRWDELGRWHSGSAEESRVAWASLLHVMEIALRRSSPAAVFELMTSNVAEADDVGRLAAYRLWRMINSQRDANGYARPPQVKQAPHVDRGPEDRPDPAVPEPGVYNPQADEVRARLRAEAEAKARAAAELREKQYRRWGITVQPLREPEHVLPDLVAAEERERRQKQLSVQDQARIRARQEGHGTRRRATESPKRATTARADKDAWAQRVSRYLPTEDNSE